MSHACCGGSDGRTAHRTAVGRRAADRLALAASPTFAVMALLTGILGGPVEMLCSGASPMNGMVVMYLLMSVFHAGPWLGLICGRRAG